MGDIFSEHGVIKPGRGKGTRISRMGKRVHASTQVYGRTSSPNEDALQQLNRILEEHDNIPAEVRQQYIGLYRTSDSLRHMNRPVLAEVMVMMYQHQIGPVGDQGEVKGLDIFSKPLIIQPYIDRVFARTETSDQKGKISDLQKQVMSIKMTDSMLAYLRNILHLISTAQQRSQAVDISTMQGPLIDQQLDIAAASSSSAPAPVPVPVPLQTFAPYVPLPSTSAPVPAPYVPLPSISAATQAPYVPLPSISAATQAPYVPLPFVSAATQGSIPSLPQLPALPTLSVPTAVDITGYRPTMAPTAPQLF